MAMLRKALVASFIGSSNKGHEVVMKSTENRYFLRWSYVARHRYRIEASQPIG